MLRMLQDIDRTEMGKATFLMGNHERMLLDAYEKPFGVTAWLENGGRSTLASFGIRDPEDLPRDALIGCLPFRHPTRTRAVIMSMPAFVPVDRASTRTWKPGSGSGSRSSPRIRLRQACRPRTYTPKEREAGHPSLPHEYRHGLRFWMFADGGGLHRGCRTGGRVSSGRHEVRKRAIHALWVCDAVPVIGAGALEVGMWT